MTSAKDYLKEVKNDLSALQKIYEDEGSTYSLIVSVSEMTLDLLRVVQKCQDTEFYSKSIKLNQDGHALRKKLLSEIPPKDLQVLSKHGISDADWILASQIAETNSDKFESGDKKTRQKIWDRYIHHLERGVFVYNMDDSTAQRMIFLADQLANGLCPDYEKSIFYLEMAIELGTEREAGEAHYNLWCIYLDEFENKKKAKKHLLNSVDLKFPEALAAYGRAHWGDWLVKEDERQAFLLIKEASELGSDWGTELLATSYDDGIGTKKNAPKAFKLRIGLGEDSSSEICCELAEHYLEGKGTPINKSEGNRLIKKAMELGNGKAHWIAAQEIYFCDDYKKLAKKRFAILKAAYELDDPYRLTFNKLGASYFHGSGTKQDFNKAKNCFERLLEVGSIADDEAYAELYLEALSGENPEEELERILGDI